MDKFFIENVPEFFAPYTNDCFSNALSGYCLFNHFDPDIMLAGYFSFMYNSKQGFIGCNYLLQPRATILFEEDELNTSYPFLWFFKPAFLKADQAGESTCWHDGVINFKLLVTEEEAIAYQKTKELLQQGIPVICAVDLHYMPYHPAYKRLHGLHFIVITGYDEHAGIFRCFDRYKIAESDYSGQLSIAQVMQARGSAVPLNDHLLGEFTRPLLYEWVEPHIPAGLQIDNQAICRMVSTSMERMNSKTEVQGNHCGIAAIEAFRDDLALRKNTEPGSDFVYYFKEYCVSSIKVISRSRKRFKQFIGKQHFLFTPALMEEFSLLLDISSRAWDITANLCYKLGLSKKPEVLDNIMQQLKKVIDSEKQLVDQIGNHLVQGGN